MDTILKSFLVLISMSVFGLAVAMSTPAMAAGDGDNIAPPAPPSYLQEYDDDMEPDGSEEPEEPAEPEEPSDPDGDSGDDEYDDGY